MTITKNMLDAFYAETLEKKQSPIVARSRRRLLLETGFSAKDRQKLKNKDGEEETASKMEEVFNYLEPLAKNEYQIESQEDGDIKMQFGANVPSLIRERAMDWAKKRGLKAKAMSLTKSSESTFWVVYGK